MARPSKYSSKYHPKMVEALSRLGLTDKEIAKEMEVTEQTLNNWKKKHPEFFASLKKGKEEPDDAVQDSLFRRALGYEYNEVTEAKDKDGGLETVKIVKKHMPADVTAQIFWLKNRRPEQWRDKREFEGEVYVLKAPDIKKPIDTGKSK